MARLSKSQIKAHNQACELLNKDSLSHDEKLFVLEHWNEGAENNNAFLSAYFTPVDLAFDFAFESASADRVIDLCAGIGALSYATYMRGIHARNDHEKPQEFVCIELNPAYIEVGKKIMPDATWIQADATNLELIKSLGRFDCAISNPPFGKNVKGDHAAPNYTGSEFEFKIMDIASQVADYGVFLIPQGSSAFHYSGRRGYERVSNAKVDKFVEETGIYMEAGIGVDTAEYEDQWKSAKPLTEIVSCNFEELETTDNDMLKPSIIQAISVSMPDNVEQLALF